MTSAEVFATEPFTIETVGIIHSCFPEKFGIPRQPLLAPSAKAQLILQPPYNDPDCVDGLEQSSHLWLTFIFHQHLKQGWKAKVRPPRLGGNKKCGVFASRSSFRPNHLGLSVVKLEKIECVNQQVILHLSGVDLLDGTPVVDIKPYIPYADSVDGAVNNWASQAPVLLDVVFSADAKKNLEQKQLTNNNVGIADIQQLLIEVLQQDPRPAYQNDEQRVYKMSIGDMTVEWCCRTGNDKEFIEVLQVR